MIFLTYLFRSSKYYWYCDEFLFIYFFWAEFSGASELGNPPSSRNEYRFEGKKKKTHTHPDER
jgi:hypothetical protein